MSDTAVRLPAEWEPHAATWLIWPQSRDWPGKLAAVRWAYVEIVRWITPGEDVHILVNAPAVADKARTMLAKARVDLARVHFHAVPTDRGWTRDSFPAFVRLANGTSAMHAFTFNGWARYATHTQDIRIPEALPELTRLSLARVVYNGRPVVLEGGAWDVNGMGDMLVTDECLLHPTRQVRNPGFTRDDYARVFRDWLGITNLIWLPGGIAGDDTHGHVDDVCRFVNPTTVVLCREDDPEDANHAVLAANREVLGRARLASGAPPTIVDLPMPRPLYFGNWRLPASYANFYIANHAVLMPTFNDPADRTALSILADCFPDRHVVGIHAVDLVLGLGSLHCLTHEQF